MYSKGKGRKSTLSFQEVSTGFHYAVQGAGNLAKGAYQWLAGRVYRKPLQLPVSPLREIAPEQRIVEQACAAINLEDLQNELNLQISRAVLSGDAALSDDQTLSRKVFLNGREMTSNEDLEAISRGKAPSLA
jgi:hypothetical protein